MHNHVIIVLRWATEAFKQTPRVELVQVYSRAKESTKANSASCARLLLMYAAFTSMWTELKPMKMCKRFGRIGGHYFGEAESRPNKVEGIENSVYEVNLTSAD